MVSTLTASTVSAVMTAARADSGAWIAVLVLLFLLLQKELASSSGNARLKRLSRALNIGILPLLIAFVLFVVARVAAVLH
jgi:hypothetical protein